MYAEEFPEREEESDCIEKASSDYVCKRGANFFSRHVLSPRV